VTTINGGGGDSYQKILFPQTEANVICVGSRGANGIVLRTTTADGNSWAAVGALPTPPAGSYFGVTLNSLGNAVYACGSAGKISSAIDTPVWTTWGNVSSPGAMTLSSIAAPEGAQFQRFVAAGDGKVYRLTGGATPTWSATTAPWTGIPQSLAFQAELNGLVVTSTGEVYTTINGGTTWELSAVHSQDTPRAVWMSRTVPGLGYIVANNGAIFKTLRGGR
jgi:photosystem II stability/assembly factor-like uncharacterized protein